MEQSYLASHVAGNKFQSFLALAESLDADEDAPTRSFQGLFRKGIHQRGKHVYWVVVTHISAHKKDLTFRVKLVQVFLFSVAHYFLSILISCIFVDAGQERLR